MRAGVEHGIHNFSALMSDAFLVLAQAPRG
jgi:hypothetical protein